MPLPIVEKDVLDAFMKEMFSQKIGQFCQEKSKQIGKENPRIGMFLGMAMQQTKGLSLQETRSAILTTAIGIYELLRKQQEKIDAPKQ